MNILSRANYLVEKHGYSEEMALCVAYAEALRLVKK